MFLLSYYGVDSLLISGLLRPCVRRHFVPEIDFLSLLVELDFRCTRLLFLVSTYFLLVISSIWSSGPVVDWIVRLLAPDLISPYHRKSTMWVIKVERSNSFRKWSLGGYRPLYWNRLLTEHWLRPVTRHSPTLYTVEVRCRELTITFEKVSIKRTIVSWVFVNSKVDETVGPRNSLILIDSEDG